jgi:hypothetical protein
MSELKAKIQNITPEHLELVTENGDRLKWPIHAASESAIGSSVTLRLQTPEREKAEQESRSHAVLNELLNAGRAHREL